MKFDGSNGVTLDLKGAQAFRRKLSQCRVQSVGVGIFEENNARDDGETNVGIGMKHEFGSHEESRATFKQQSVRGRGPMGWGGVPERSFLRTPLMTMLPGVVERDGESVIADLMEVGVKGALERIGHMGEAVVQEAFNTNGYGEWQPNSAKTVNWKGSNQPLVDTHQLRNSISSKVGQFT